LGFLIVIEYTFIAGALLVSFPEVTKFSFYFSDTSTVLLVLFSVLGSFK